MKKYDIINKVINTGVVSVVRADDMEKATAIINGCMLGGINAIEVTFTMDFALELLEKYRYTNAVLGAGSVFDSETARLAILSGAEFIVSPSFDLDTAKLCNRYHIPYIPGCMTITEVVTATSIGCDIIKLFPASQMGPGFIKSIKAPLPNVQIMPTGGVDINNIGDWIKAGSICVGIGGEFTKLADFGKHEEIASVAKAYVDKVKEAKGAL